MRTRKAVFILFVFLSYVPVLAQVDMAWVRRYNGPDNLNDQAYAIAVDKSGNVYVAGFSEAIGFNSNYCIIRYSPNGDTSWVKRYNGPGNSGDVVNDLVIDSSGNIYVTGQSWGSGTEGDFTTIKYAPNGDSLWVRRYDGSGNGNDASFFIVIDSSGNVCITGVSPGNGTSYDYATVKYAPNGDTLWVRRYNGPANSTDWPLALAIDADANVYVTGWSAGSGTGLDYGTIKYAPNGDTLWVRRYNSPGNGDDIGTGLVVDADGNVYVTGYSWNSGTTIDYVTIKYASNGDTLWVRPYNGPVNSFDYAYDLAIDIIGNVYVTGESRGSGYTYDYATVKYSPSGDTLWVRRYNGPGGGTDRGYLLGLDNSGSLYVSGNSWSNETDNDYATIKYSSDGKILWLKRYNGPSDSNDVPSAMAINSAGNVYVTGRSWNGTDYDYATIKYIQFDCLAIPGDANSDSTVLLSDIVTIINFLFKSQPAPNPSCRADANADGSVLLSDIVHLINFLFKSGPAPQKSRECCL